MLPHALKLFLYVGETDIIKRWAGDIFPYPSLYIILVWLRALTSAQIFVSW